MKIEITKTLKEAILAIAAEVDYTGFGEFTRGELTDEHVTAWFVFVAALRRSPACPRCGAPDTRALKGESLGSTQCEQCLHVWRNHS